ncbi:MAG: A/G-specific adenine glycosylase [Planctomycetia bacterium]|nr:A/G-specific adenine glycosylase [Planctomycetia bacterium]
MLAVSCQLANAVVTLRSMSDPLADITAPWLRRFRQSLKRWHAQHGRDLPWRNCRDPYKVWISEIMLQQTTVVAVKPYFERFLQRFPDVASLASANEEDVLRLWEGLGYYSRARNLHRAASAIVEHGGEFPETVEELQQLPGIGRYTAGAIVSFAFDRPAPIVEANTLRLYSRLLGYRDDPRSTVGQRLLWSFAEKLVPSKGAGEFNQALTDLGAIVCTPTEPRCGDCPVASCCRALAEQAQAEIPQAAKRPEITELSEASIAIESKGRFLLIRRPEGARWAGLWDFPRFELSPLRSHHAPRDEPAAPNDSLSNSRRTKKNRDRREAIGSSRGAMTATNLPASPLKAAAPQEIAQLEQRLVAEFGLVAKLTERLTQIKHSVTRYRITLDCWHAACEDSREVTTELDNAWVAPADFEQYPLSVTGRKLADLIVRKFGKDA